MKKYGMFLLIFSYVISSITGLGIWYTATAASHRGISALIHNFVWVWATEWVFFVYEVVGVFALVYFIDKVDRKTHLRLTYTFALASVGTLALIIGNISTVQHSVSINIRPKILSTINLKPHRAFLQNEWQV